MATARQIEANRKNARHSSGPRTEGGKARSRMNGLVHGLRSEEAVLPTESREEYESHVAAWMDDWKPPTETRRFLVERAATAAWRLRRCVRAETDRMAKRARRGYAEWDQLEAEAADRAVGTLEDRPVEAMARLRATRPGIDRLLRIWCGLVDLLNTPDGWDSVGYHDTFCYLIGVDDDTEDERLLDLSVTSISMLTRLRPEAAPEIDPYDEEMYEEGREELLDVCGREVEALIARRDALPTTTPARERFAEAKAFEMQPEDATYQRYEGRLDREARAAIAQLMALEKSGLDLVEADAPTEPDPPASDRPTEPDSPTTPPPGAETGTTEPNSAGAIGGVACSGRDRGGRIWPVGGPSAADRGTQIQIS